MTGGGRRSSGDEQFEDVQSFPFDFKDVEERPDVVSFTSGHSVRLTRAVFLAMNPASSPSG